MEELLIKILSLAPGKLPRVDLITGVYYLEIEVNKTYINLENVDLHQLFEDYYQILLSTINPQPKW